MVLVLVVAAVLLGGLLTPGRAFAAVPTTIELHLERPVWKLKERMVVTGRLSADGRGLGGRPVQVGVNGSLAATPYRTTTAPDGTYRLEFGVEDSWGFGGQSLTALFTGQDGYADSRFTTIFRVAPDQVAPVALAVHQPPAPVAPGQQVRLTGTLHNDRREPAAGHSVIAVIDAANEHRAFSRVSDDGAWALDFTVPMIPGEWSAAFPEYRVAVVYEGDWSLAPAQVDVVLTLAHPPVEPVVAATPAPTPKATANPTPRATPVASVMSVQDPTPPSGPLPAWLPNWVASPVFLLSAVAFAALLLGATFIAHGRADA